ncbi:hypothetical protein EDM76_01330, partial [bacterium]
GGTYEDAGHRIGYHSAVSIRIMERTPVEHAAHFAFRLAERHRHKVVSTSKYTIQRAADGLFEEVVAEVAKEYRNVTHERELFDSLLARLIIKPETFDVIVTPNEYGDFLSDAVYGLIGSIGLGASASYAFTPSHQPNIGIFDPAGGTAPDIAGKGIANPSGAIEAYGYLLQYCGVHGCRCRKGTGGFVARELCPAHLEPGRTQGCSGSPGAPPVPGAHTGLRPGGLTPRIPPPVRLDHVDGLVRRDLAAKGLRGPPECDCHRQVASRLLEDPARLVRGSAQPPGHRVREVDRNKHRVNVVHRLQELFAPCEVARPQPIEQAAPQLAHSLGGAVEVCRVLNPQLLG